MWLKDVESEARSIWNEGKELGVTALGNEEDVIQRLVHLEQRDAQVAHCSGAVPRGSQEGLP